MLAEHFSTRSEVFHGLITHICAVKLGHNYATGVAEMSSDYVLGTLVPLSAGNPVADMASQARKTTRYEPAANNVDFNIVPDL